MAWPDGACNVHAWKGLLRIHLHYSFPGFSGKCMPCPSGEYWMQSCRRCPPGTVLNHTALALMTESAQNGNHSFDVSPCSPCSLHFERSTDGFSCEFTGHFDLDVGNGKGKKVNNNEERMHFDLSALRESSPFTARVCKGCVLLPC